MSVLCHAEQVPPILQQKGWRTVFFYDVSEVKKDCSSHLIFKPFFLSGYRKRLAWEASQQNIVIGNLLCNFRISDIAIRILSEICLVGLTGECVVFGRKNVYESTCHLECSSHSPYPCTQVNNAKFSQWRYLQTSGWRYLPNIWLAVNRIWFGFRTGGCNLKSYGRRSRSQRNLTEIDSFVVVHQLDIS